MKINEVEKYSDNNPIQFDESKRIYKKYQCPFCDLKITKLRRHIESMHKSKKIETKKSIIDKKFQCTICGKKTIHEYNLKIHIKSAHKDEKSAHKDEKSDNEIIDISEAHENEKPKDEKLEINIDAKKMKLDEKFQCFFCEEKAVSVSHLKRHMQVIFFESNIFT